LDESLNISKEKAVLLRKVAEKRHRPSNKFRHSRINSSVDLFSEIQSQKTALNTREKYTMTNQLTAPNFRSKSARHRNDARCLTLCIVDNLSNGKTVVLIFTLVQINV
jgi:hypothetical protein